MPPLHPQGARRTAPRRRPRPRRKATARRRPPPSGPAPPPPSQRKSGCDEVGSGPRASSAAAMSPALPTGPLRPRDADQPQGWPNLVVGAVDLTASPSSLPGRRGRATPLRRPGEAPPPRGGPATAVLGARKGSRPAPLVAARTGSRRRRALDGAGRSRRPRRPRRGRPERVGMD
jgi:hypothetical protein